MGQRGFEADEGILSAATMVANGMPPPDAYAAAGCPGSHRTAALQSIRKHAKAITAARAGAAASTPATGASRLSGALLSASPAPQTPAPQTLGPSPGRGAKRHLAAEPGAACGRHRRRRWVGIAG